MSSRNRCWITWAYCGTKAAVLATFAVLMIAACSATPGGAVPAGLVQNQTNLISALRAKGLTVQTLDPVEQPFLQADGVGLRVSGGILPGPAELQSFEYADSAAAAEDASQIEPNGNPRTMRIDWIAPPHLFRRERVMVIYLGSDATLLALLKELLGPQFAGK